MDDLKELLSSVMPRSLLDVATGSGNSLGAAIEIWPHCDRYTGIDLSDKGFELAMERFSGDGRIRFEVMDASAIGFPDDSLDAVMMLNSLHHMERPGKCLEEMYRVLAPGGLMWVAEMYRDGQRATQMTHVLCHHWWSRVDRLVGISHNETFTRQELMDLAGSLDPGGIDVLDNHGDDSSVHDPGIIEHFEKAFESYREKYGHLPERDELEREGEELLQRVRDVGFAHASQLNLVIRKR